MASDRRSQYYEGPDAARRFTDAMNRVLSVSKDELVQRDTAHKQARRRKRARAKKSA
jgi:hypothetical protein